MSARVARNVVERVPPPQARRLFVAILIWSIPSLLAYTLLYSLLAFFSLPEREVFIGSILVSTVIFFLVFAFSVNLFFVSVPEITGLITINVLRKPTKKEPYRNYYVYGTGLRLKYPWEQVKEGNYINLRLVTKQHKENYPSKEGPLLETKWSYQYRPRLYALPVYIAVDDTTIDDGFSDVGSSYLANEIAGKPAGEAKSEQKNTERGLVNHFKTSRHEPEPGAEPITLEELYGVDLERVSIADIDYEESYQRALATSASMAVLRKEAGKLAKAKGMEFKTALDSVMARDKSVVKTVAENVHRHSIETSEEHVKDGLAAIAALLRGGDSS